jgi:hypothetical protein
MTNETNINKDAHNMATLQSRKTSSAKSLIAVCATVLALILSLAAGQPAQAEEPIGQMIDDSGLVISSFADGSIREVSLDKPNLLCLDTFQHHTNLQSTVINDADHVVLAEGNGLR